MEAMAVTYQMLGIAGLTVNEEAGCTTVRRTLEDVASEDEPCKLLRARMLGGGAY